MIYDLMLCLLNSLYYFVSLLKIVLKFGWVVNLAEVESNSIKLIIIDHISIKYLIYLEIIIDINYKIRINITDTS